MLHEDIFPWIPQIKRGCCKTSPFCSSPFSVPTGLAQLFVFPLQRLFEDTDFFVRTEKRFPVGFQIIQHQIKEAHEKRNLFRFDPAKEI